MQRWDIFLLNSKFIFKIFFWVGRKFPAFWILLFAFPQWKLMFFRAIIFFQKIKIQASKKNNSIWSVCLKASKGWKEGGFSNLLLVKIDSEMIRKLKSGEYRIYSRKINPKTKKRRNLGTFSTLEAAKKHEREIEFFKRHWLWFWIPFLMDWKR